jgi:trehalose 6-phosphate phosphatase
MSSCDSALETLPGCELESKAWPLRCTIARRRAAERGAVAGAGIVKRYPILALQLGKCVVEIKPRGVNKGKRSRVYAGGAVSGAQTGIVGDDLTDEAGFSVVNQLGGMSVKVGKGDTQAQWRLPDVAAVQHWLISIANNKQQPDAQNDRRRVMGRLVVVSNRIAPPDDKGQRGRPGRGHFGRTGRRWIVVWLERRNWR